MLPRSYSHSQITLAVEGHPLKRRRLESFKSEANLTSSSQSRTIQLSPSPSCSRIPPPSSHELRTFVGAIPPRADSPVPTEPDADHADRADVERDLERRWGIRVKDYARLSPPASPRKDKGKQKATDSDERERVWEAFFAKDAMGQYEWFMSRGSKEWLILKWEGTEVLEESQEPDERTEEDVTKMPPIQQQLGEKSPQSSPGRSPRPLVRTTHNPLAITCKKRTPSPPSTSSQPVSEQASPQRGLTRQDTQALFKPPSTATANPGRGLVRHTRNPMTMTSVNTSSNSSFTTPPNSTASTSLQTPNDEEYLKTPLLPSPSFLQREQRRNIRKHGIPGKILHRLREIGWITEDEARRRWLGCDWDEYHEYAVREEKRGNTRKHQDEIGYMGKGEIGYPYYVIWGSVGTGGLGFKKGKSKDSEGSHTKEPETAQQKEEEPEEEFAESQNVHATLSGTIEDLEEEEQVTHDQEDMAITQESNDSGYPDTEPDSEDIDIEPEEEQSQNVHATLSGSLSPPPPESPRQSSSSTSTTPSSPPQASPSQKEKKPNPLAPLYFHAVAEDSSLAFNRPPSRDYRRLLGERAGDVWNWLGEWVKYGRAGKKAFTDSGFFEEGALAGGGIKRQGTVGRGLVRNGTLSSIPGPGNGAPTHTESDKDRMDVDPQPRRPSSPKRLELPPNWLSSLSSLSSIGSDDEMLPSEDEKPPASSSPMPPAVISEPAQDRKRKLVIPSAKPESRSKASTKAKSPPKSPPRRSARLKSPGPDMALRTGLRRSARTGGGS